MNPTVKNKLDYLWILVILYFFSVGLKSILYFFINDSEHILIGSVDVFRFNIEIGLVLFYLKGINLRNNLSKLEIYKILVLCFCWVFFIKKLNDK